MYYLLLAITMGSHFSFRQTLPPAANLPQKFEVRVFGHPALASTVSSAAYGVAETQLSAVSNATWTVQVPPVSPLAEGKAISLQLKVVVQAPGHIASEGIVNVRVTNEPIHMAKEGLLWFCNKPENLREAGPLFQNHLPAGQSVRILYHHTNRGTQPLYMRAELVNQSDLVARVLIIPGDARPNREPVLAGLAAAKHYLFARLAGSGEILTVPPHSVLPIALRRVVMRGVLSGLCSLQLLSGGPEELNLREDAVAPFDSTRNWDLALMNEMPWHELKPRMIEPQDLIPSELNPLVYSDPNIAQFLSAEVGGKPASVRIGVEGIPRVGGGRALNGNYGVISSIRVDLKNATSQSGSVGFYLEASTNYTAGLFITKDGQVVVSPIQKGKRKQFYSVNLPPHSSMHWTLSGLPISGGGYPATIFAIPQNGTVAVK